MSKVTIECPDCGATRERYQSEVKNLKSFRCKSCHMIKHNKNMAKWTTDKDNPNYSRYNGIKMRCYNPSRKDYPRYGGRGITMSDIWLNDLDLFVNYIESLPNSGREGYSLDRVHNDFNYEPMNLRWATDSTQARNQRQRKSITGYTGITTHKDGGFVTRITVDGVRIYLGYYQSNKEATTVRNDYIIKHKLPDKIQEIV